MAEHMSFEQTCSTIAAELQLKDQSGAGVYRLFEEGATVPFIARYRKEATGTLDEVAITAIRDRTKQLEELEKRREAILKSLTERQLLTPDLEKAVSTARTIIELEDVYLPFKPKRKTRASAAREKGLEPLALSIFAYKCNAPSLEAKAFINEELGVATEVEALAGARDIIAELVNENVDVRKSMRQLWDKKALMQSTVVKAKEAEGIKYKDYFDWSEPASTAPSHRVLAMLRAESEGIVRVNITPDAEEALQRLQQRFVKGKDPVSEQINLALQDSLKRLLAPSMETELRSKLKEKADAEAIKVFTNNLRQLLMAPPLGQKRVLAIDPGLRTGCKSFASALAAISNITTFCLCPLIQAPTPSVSFSPSVRSFASRPSPWATEPAAAKQKNSCAG